MKKLLFLIIPLFIGCSNNETTAIAPKDYFKITIDDITTDLLSGEGNIGTYGISVGENVITVRASIYPGGYNNNLYLLFNKQGELIEANLFFNNGGYEFKNFEDFPKNYFSARIIKLDTENKKIKFSFNGKLYSNKNNLNSYHRYISGEINANYQDNVSVYPNIMFGHINQYCNATINNQPWVAKFERQNSIFTAEDPYKIKINIALSSSPGNFNFDNNSTNNFVKFYKFNTQTLVYDEYIVNGNLAYSYREFHGAGNYSHIGMFSLTATNPNNALDVITISDGSYRNYQHY